MDTAIRLKFADGQYLFWLPLPRVVELERKTGASILAIEERLRGAIGVAGEDEDGEPDFVFVGGGSALVREVLETLRLGLIGGNSGLVGGEEVQVGPGMADQLVADYAYPARPFSEGVVLAWRVLHAAIHGIQLQKKSPAPAAESMSPSEKAS